MLEAMDELRDVMVQYYSYADPTESAAMRERLRQAEEAGQFEETAAQMVRSSLDLQNQDSYLGTEPTHTSLERIHVAFRLGPTFDHNKSVMRNKEQAPTEKKPEKALGKKNARVSPKVLMGSNSRKMKSIEMGTSQRRKLNLDTSNQNHFTNFASAEASGSRRIP